MRNQLDKRYSCIYFYPETPFIKVSERFLSMQIDETDEPAGAALLPEICEEGDDPAQPRQEEDQGEQGPLHRSEYSQPTATWCCGSASFRIFWPDPDSISFLNQLLFSYACRESKNYGKQFFFHTGGTIYIR